MKQQDNTLNASNILGEIIWLMSHSELHREWPIGGIQQWVMPALLHKQFRVYRRNDKPFGYIAWAWLSKEVEERYILNTSTLHPKDWQSGRRGWIIDYLAPFGGTREIVRDLKNGIFKDDVGRYLRVKPGKDTMQIRYVHGANAVNKYNPTVDLKTAAKHFSSEDQS